MGKRALIEYKAVILAGGKGTRLYPVTKEIPKPLLSINRKPIINYLVDLFFSHGVRDIGVLISKDFRDDFRWWKDRYYPSVSSWQDSSAGQSLVPHITLFEEKEPLGTFGGLSFIKDWVGGSHFFLSNGDELKEIDLTKMAALHEKVKPVGTLALVKVSNPRDYGVVVCNSSTVKEFLEKPENPPSNYINSGLYLLAPEIFNYHPGPKFLMIEKDVFPRLAQEQKLAGFKFSGRWMDCGTWERYSNAQEQWKKGEA